MSAACLSAAKVFAAGQTLCFIAYAMTDAGPLRSVEIRTAVSCGALWLLLTAAARLSGRHQR